MLSSLLNVLGRSFGILMGWRRTHRPGDLTARIFIEHDRAVARLAANSNAPKVLLSSKLKSINSSALASRASRVTVRAERIELISDRAVARIARTNTVIAKRDTRRVVWLDISPKPKATDNIILVASSAVPELSNVVCLRKTTSDFKAEKSHAA